MPGTESYYIIAKAIFHDNKGFIGADFKGIVFGRILPSVTFIVKRKCSRPSPEMIPFYPTTKLATVC